jgi:TolB-like protein/Tfp pilus assembly protein PilF
MPESGVSTNPQTDGTAEPEAVNSTVPVCDVFVSYASPDAAVANAVVESLERHGIKCWIAPRDVTPGGLYADGIIRAINRAKVLVLVLSASAIASPHVGKEVERASSKQRTIITLRTDTAPLTAALEYFLSESQWVELDAEGMDAAVKKVVDAVRARMAAASASDLDAPQDRPSLDRKTRSPRQSWMMPACIALLGIALVWLAVDKFWLSKHITHAELPSPATPTPAGVGFAPPPHSIAVLPFVNMSADAKQEYFSDGITEELLNSLSRLNELQVAARTSSFSFKGQSVDVSTIARKLNVGTILEGSVRRAGNTVRITVQLINAVDGFHLWSQTYDRNLTDILKVQAEVAATVAQQLKITLVGDDIEKLGAGGTKLPEAYEAYLRGVELLTNWDTEETDLRAAVATFDRAIALDPDYALAHARRAVALSDISIFDNVSPTELARVRAQALQAAERAVALAPELGEVHLTLAQVRSNGLLDFDGAAPEFERALALSPGSARVQRGVAGFASQLGHFDAAVRAARRAVILDPQNVESHVELGQILTHARRYEEALAALRNAALLRPNSLFVRYNVANALLASGEFEQARALCESSLPQMYPARNLLLAVAYHGLGRQRDAVHELDLYKARPGGGASLEMAGVYAQWGDTAAALQTLTRAERQHDPAFQLLRVYWGVDPIRNEPQFKAIEARMNFPP